MRSTCPCAERRSMIISEGEKRVTAIHEAGHAVVAAVVGRRLTGIRLHSDTSGVTVSRGRPRGPGMVATVLAGYPAPALVGLAGALVLGQGYAAGLLWGLVLLCALMLLLVRNLYGWWVLLVTGGAVGALSWTASGEVVSGAAYLVVWALLLAAPRSVVELQRERRRRGRVVRRRGAARAAPRVSARAVPAAARRRPQALV